MTILLYKEDAETAHKVVDYFAQNPGKNLCRVGIGGKEIVVFLRSELPRLKKIMNSSLPNRPPKD